MRYVPSSDGATNGTKNVPLAVGWIVPSALLPCCTVRLLRGSRARQLSVTAWDVLPAAASADHWAMRSDASSMCRTGGICTCAATR